jgi:hypothetical protein
MSSIIFLLSPDQAFIATDTLSVTTDGTPLNFTTKAFVVPHLKLVIAGTGLAGVSSAWFRRINESMLVSDIDHLNHHTQVSLTELCSTEFSNIDEDEISTTIYHVGVGADGDIHGYSYSSRYGFESRPIEYGLSMKPGAGVEPDPESPRTFIELMEAQKGLQQQVDAPSRVYIGGQAQVVSLDKAGNFHIFYQGNISDYEDDKDAMYMAFKRTK